MVGDLRPTPYRGRDPIRPVVLIDEIDKAPRDLPNDILNEVERMEFTVKETGRRFPDFELHERALRDEGLTEAAARATIEEYRAVFAANRPILVLTSNDEKKLPDAFLRRCVYYHIPFPDPAREDGRKTLRTIVRNRLGSLQDDGFAPEYLEDDYLNASLSLFSAIRSQLREKKPATAELIGWIRMLERKRIPPEELQRPTPATIAALKSTISVLVKSQEDRTTAERYLDGLKETAAAPSGAPVPAGGGRG